MREERVRVLKVGEAKRGPVLYWMSRDQRAVDNWALVFAQSLALERGVPLGVAFCLVENFLGATLRQYGFMLRGLDDVRGVLQKKSIPFFLLRGEPGTEIVRFVKAHGIGALVTDFDPLRIRKPWKKAVVEGVSVPFYEVDAHNVAPAFAVTPRQEYAARTFRPRVMRVLDEFLDPFPELADHPFPWPGKKGKIQKGVDILPTLRIDRAVGEASWIRPGTAAGLATLAEFVKSGLNAYPESRNDPVRDGQSGLSPYLHFGQVGPQRVALAVRDAHASPEAKKAFLEEAVVRRELSDNFCLHNEAYDSLEGAPAWARKTLRDHRRDRRSYRYRPEILEAAETHDSLWNAAQMEMAKRGKMHGYMRMYWAKKILEWTGSPEDALAIAVRLNDRYELDGRDPNGYVGCLWSIGGLHDRAWPARPVFGNVRYMNDRGARRKFDVDAYIRKVASF